MYTYQGHTVVVALQFYLLNSFGRIPQSYLSLLSSQSHRPLICDLEDTQMSWPNTLNQYECNLRDEDPYLEPEKIQCHNYGE